MSDRMDRLIRAAFAILFIGGLFYIALTRKSETQITIEETEAHLQRIDLKLDILMRRTKCLEPMRSPMPLLPAVPDRDPITIEERIF